MAKLKKTSLVGSLLALSAATAGGLASGCGTNDGAEKELVEQLEEPFNYVGAALWVPRNVNVCFMSVDDDYQATIWRVLKGQRSWEQWGNVNLIGGGDCVRGQPFNGIRVQPSFNGDNKTTPVGQDPIGGITTVELDLEDIEDSDQLQEVALHEFGHALGVAHEHNRNADAGTACHIPIDSMGKCPSGTAPRGGKCESGTEGTHTFGACDGPSIMNYKTNTDRLSHMDRMGFEAAYRARSGDIPRHGNADGDWRDDLICHDATDGTTWVWYSETDGSFANDAWVRPSGWCGASNERLFKGDFNDDERTDLLCFNVVDGTLRVDHASTSGRYDGGGNAIPNTLCTASGNRVLIGDVNGDNRDDFICLTSASRYHVDLANANGLFGNIDVAHSLSTCIHPEKAMIGDFDADTRSDLMCIGLGTIKIFYGGTDGRFGARQWSASNNLCNFPEGYELIGDFNGDLRDDILCMNVLTAAKTIEYSSNGTFTGAAANRWATTWPWCRSEGQRLSIGDFDGDLRDDLLCHDTYDGDKWIDLADDAGHFGNNDWTDFTSDWCWHDSGVLH
jgi:hypothetical protein